MFVLALGFVSVCLQASLNNLQAHFKHFVSNLEFV